MGNLIQHGLLQLNKRFILHTVECLSRFYCSSHGNHLSIPGISQQHRFLSDHASQLVIIGRSQQRFNMSGHGSHLLIPGVSQQHLFFSGHPSQMLVPGLARINSNCCCCYLAVPGPIPPRTDGRVSNFLRPSDLAWDAEWPPWCLCQSLMAEQTSTTTRTQGQKFFVCPKSFSLRCDCGIWLKTRFHRRAPPRT